MATPKYPEVEINLLGHDANMSAIIATTRRALRRAGVDAATIEEFTNDVTGAGDYYDAWARIEAWVTVTG